MPDPKSEQPTGEFPVVLLTGYIGRRLLALLEQRDVRVRCLARKPEKLQSQAPESTDVVKGDVLDKESLGQALAGVTTTC